VTLTGRQNLRHIPGGLALVVLLSLSFPAKAIIIDSESGPIVTNTNDNGTGSLREALLEARDGDTITFDIPISDPGYHAGAWTISLTSGELPVDKNVTVSGPGPDHLVLKRDKRAPAFRIFPIDAERALTIDGLTIGEATAQTTPFVLLAGGTTTMLAMSGLLFGRHVFRRNERRVRFGLLWNGHKRPICAKCGRSLKVLNDYSFQCPSCEVELGAREDGGLTISPREALTRIRLKEYWSSN
jgi:hypothetical protein